MSVVNIFWEVNGVRPHQRLWRVLCRSFVVIGAPKANTSQSGVTEGGSVFLCPWSPGGGSCDIIKFDLEGKFQSYSACMKVASDCDDVIPVTPVVPVAGDEDYNSSGLFFQSFKSQQWFGASVRSVSSSHLLVRTYRHTDTQTHTFTSVLMRMFVCLLVQ